MPVSLLLQHNTMLSAKCLCRFVPDRIQDDGCVHSVGEQDDNKELTASLAERCAHLQEAFQEATCRLADARAAEARLQFQNSILRAENSALTARSALVPAPWRNSS